MPERETLALDYMRDLVTDARCSEKFARAVDRGETGYGCTADEYRERAKRTIAEYHTLRSASDYRIGRYGEVTAV